MFPWPEWLPKSTPLRMSDSSIPPKESQGGNVPESSKNCNLCPLINILETRYAELNFRIKDLERKLNNERE